MFTLFKAAPLSLRQIAALIGLMLLSSFASMLMPAILAGMFDIAIPDQSRKTILIFGAVMLVSALFSCLFSAGSARISAKLSTGFAGRLRQAVFEKVQSFSPAETDRFSSSSLLVRCTSDVSTVQMFVMMALQIGILAPLSAVAGVVMSSSSGGAVSSVLSVSVPILIVVCAILLILSARYSMKLRKQLDRLNRLFIESLQGVRVIRAFGRQSFQIQTFEKADSEYAMTSIANGRVSSLLMPSIQTIFGLTMCAVLFAGSWSVGQGELEAGTLAANVQYVSLILSSVIMVAAVVMMFPSAWASGSRIAEVLNTKPEIEDPKNPENAQSNSEEVLSFDHVFFSYPHAQSPVLQDLSLTCQKGKMTALIGPTGSGKSTVLKLAERFYDPTGGQILFEGTPLCRQDLSSARSRVAYVPQKSVIFSGTVASNLKMENPDASLEDMKQAARLACADEFIEAKEGGFESRTEKGGANFSGGQKQRLSIARALMKKADLLLMDDSFSALDALTEHKLLSNLKETRKDRALLVASSRISTIKEADVIIVLDHGKTVGRGTHNELLRSCPLYQKLAALQNQDEAEAEGKEEA